MTACTKVPSSLISDSVGGAATSWTMPTPCEMAIYAIRPSLIGISPAGGLQEPSGVESQETVYALDATQPSSGSVRVTWAVFRSPKQPSVNKCSICEANPTFITTSAGQGARGPSVLGPTAAGAGAFS